jgi:metal dependent phosphohydrolase
MHSALKSALPLPNRNDGTAMSAKEATEMVAEPKVITLEDVKANEKVQTFIRLSDEQMEAIGYTEHGFRHVSLVAHNARRILQDLGFNDRQPELAAIAGYLHDVGNMISRIMHSKTGAMIAMQVLLEWECHLMRRG